MSSKDMLGDVVRKLVELSGEILGLVYDLLCRLHDPVWVEALKKFLRKEEACPARDVFKVVVNYAQSLADMISAGKYGSVNSDITAENFPISGSGQVELNAELVHFNRVMESDDVLKKLDKAGLRPATIAELLAFGAKYPDKQREFPIIALGSVWRYRGGSSVVPVLFWSASDERGLNLYLFGSRWHEDYRFLAFRKPA